MAACVVSCSPALTLRGPTRPVNRVLVAGMVQTTNHMPVPGARVIAQLLDEALPGAAGSPCQGALDIVREAFSLATGEFNLLIESPGPQFDACLVVKVFAPPGSGLKDTTLSSQRFRFEVPRAGEVPTIHLEVTLSAA